MFFFFLLLEPRRTCVCANMVCLLTSAVLQEPDRNKLGDPDFPSDSRGQSSSVLLVLFCLECCRPTAQTLSLMHVSQVKTTAFKQNLNDLLLVTDVIQGGWWGGGWGVLSQMHLSAVQLHPILVSPIIWETCGSQYFCFLIYSSFNNQEEEPTSTFLIHFSLLLVDIKLHFSIRS